jgi:threonyl-tRNA synthetase
LLELIGKVMKKQAINTYLWYYFSQPKELDEYLLMLEEAKKRDHRKLGKELGIYTMNDDIGAGLILWMPNGTVIIEELEKLAKETEDDAGYKRSNATYC